MQGSLLRRIRSGFSVGLGEKRGELFIYLFALAFRARHLGICIPFLEREENHELLVAIAAHIFIGWHNRTLLPPIVGSPAFIREKPQASFDYEDRNGAIGNTIPA